VSPVGTRVDRKKDNVMAETQKSDFQKADLKVMGVLETVLYVDDFERSFKFYNSLFGFQKELADPTLYVLKIKDGQFLLLFLRSIANEPALTKSAVGEFDGVIPPHGAQGSIHLCFSIHSSDLSRWLDKLAAENVAVEGKARWNRGGTSVYFRDPDGHMIEIATRGVWPTF
jgi:catechol 2,3-dioxygenase-like lactoylglutathione lyase family enzyme